MPSENAGRLEAAVIMALTTGASIPSEADVLALAQQLRGIPLYSLNDDEFQDVIRRIHASLRISMGLGTVVIEENHVPWLSARKASIQPFYWDRYKILLRQQGLAPNVITTIDRVTDSVLDLLGNPEGTAGWPRRGLVMGDVQSGKTSNYTGLICKAADAGYRLVILLTGTLESLRRQTQERLDFGFVGLDSSGVVNRSRQTREIGVGRINGARVAGVFTSNRLDFKVEMANQLGFRLDAIHEPVLLVVKKHKKILENLASWLVSLNADSNGKIDLPMLLIDDEADNASVNTSPTRVTAINGAIRGLLHVFRRSSYVGFTATPFANVFIDPDTEEEMLGNDLFPRDFIYALEAPTNYVGASAIFGEDAKVDCLREIDDAAEAFPEGHRAWHVVTAIPETLKKAFLSFLVTNAILDKRSGMPRHRSMLINVTHFTNVQEQIKEYLDEYLRAIKEDIRNYSKLNERDALKNPTMRDLKDVWQEEYQSAGCDWKAVQAALQEAVLPIEVRSVNQKSGAASLDYSQYKDAGLRVVAVGGNSLSRGLTLEGLCVSYFYRGTQMYDALLQMGRWFGYRDGYIDLCRIWMSELAMEWYGLISGATEELRNEVRRMQAANLTPRDFGLKVRAHPESLLITARNKMRDSEEIERVISVSGEGLETSRLLSDETAIRANWLSAKRFIAKLKASEIPQGESPLKNPIWKGVQKRQIIEFLRQFTPHPLHVSFQTRDIADFLESASVPELDLWDVVIPSGREDVQNVEGVDVRPQQRRLAVDARKRSILVSEKKMRVGSRGIEKEGLTSDEVARAEALFRENPENEGKDLGDAAYRMARSKPLLLVHFLKGKIVTRHPSGEKSETPYDVGDAVLVALGLSFPAFDDSAAVRRVKYRVNLVEWRNMLDFEEGDDEEGDVDEP